MVTVDKKTRRIKMKLINLLVLTAIASCGHGYRSYKDNSWHPDVYEGDRIVCPKDYHYKPITQLCHKDIKDNVSPIPSKNAEKNSLSPKLGVSDEKRDKDKGKRIRTSKRPALPTNKECSAAIGLLPFCGVKL
jgi:hypothetical protein